VALEELLRTFVEAEIAVCRFSVYLLGAATA